MVEINGVCYLNLQEQVKKNKCDIEELKAAGGTQLFVIDLEDASGTISDEQYLALSGKPFNIIRLLHSSYPNFIFKFHREDQYAMFYNSIKIDGITGNPVYAYCLEIDKATKQYEIYVNELLSSTSEDLETSSDEIVGAINENKSSIDNVREVAEGKCKTYIISTADNPIFNTQASVVGTNSITTTSGDVIQSEDLKIGDIILILELDVPDRWYAGNNIIGITHGYSRLEAKESASAVELSYVIESGDSEVNVDLNQDESKLLISLHAKEVVISAPISATSGTLTDAQLAALKESSNSYIVFNNEKYYLNDDSGLSGYLGYSHVGVENSEFMIKNITVTESTKAWVLTTFSEDSKLDKITSSASYKRVYAIDTDGDQETLNVIGKFNYSASADTALAMYNNGVLTTGTPSSNNDCSNKKYVDDLTSINKLTIYYGLGYVGGTITAFQIGHLVVITLNANLSATAGQAIITNLPPNKTGAAVGGAIASDSTGRRVIIDNNGTILKSDTGGISAGWYNGCIVYYTD